MSKPALYTGLSWTPSLRQPAEAKPNLSQQYLGRLSLAKPAMLNFFKTPASGFLTLQWRAIICHPFHISLCVYVVHGTKLWRLPKNTWPLVIIGMPPSINFPAHSIKHTQQFPRSLARWKRDQTCLHGLVLSILPHSVLSGIFNNRCLNQYPTKLLIWLEEINILFYSILFILYIWILWDHLFSGFSKNWTFVFRRLTSWCGILVAARRRPLLPSGAQVRSRLTIQIRSRLVQDLVQVRTWFCLGPEQVRPWAGPLLVQIQSRSGPGQIRSGPGPCPSPVPVRFRSGPGPIQVRFLYYSFWR